MKIQMAILGVLVGASLLTACGQSTVDSGEVAVTPGPTGSTPSGGSSATVAARTNNIDRNYLLTFDEERGVLSFMATFRVSGTWSTTVRLSPPAELVVNGRHIGEEQLMSEGGAVMAGLVLPLFSPLFYAASGTHYFTTIPASNAFAPQSIDWTDQGGMVFHDQMQVSPVSVSVLPQTASISSGLSVGVGVGEYSVEITQHVGDGSYKTASARGSGSLRFAASELKDLQPGSATLVITRETETQLQSEGSGRATGTAIYKTRPAFIQVVP